jgi:hypothetical protein
MGRYAVRMEHDNLRPTPAPPRLPEPGDLVVFVYDRGVCGPAKVTRRTGRYPGAGIVDLVVPGPPDCLPESRALVRELVPYDPSGRPRTWSFPDPAVRGWQPSGEPAAG